MGVYSQVALCITDSAYTTFRDNINKVKDHVSMTENTYEEILNVLDKYCDHFTKDNCHLLVWDSIKWYDTDIHNPAFWIEGCLCLITVPFNFKDDKATYSPEEYDLSNLNNIDNRDFKLIDLGFSDGPFYEEYGDFWDNPFNLGPSYSINYKI